MSAPSVHNSQPWRWTYSARGLDLSTDSSRVLGVIDPTERQMVLSCGAALDHLDKAAAAFRWTTEIDPLPHRVCPVGQNLVHHADCSVLIVR